MGIYLDIKADINKVLNVEVNIINIIILLLFLK
jgi:hypothetical protein